MHPFKSRDVEDDSDFDDEYEFDDGADDLWARSLDESDGNDWEDDGEGFDNDAFDEEAEPDEDE